MLMPPLIKGMSVSGLRGRRSNEVFILLEEYEAIRLLDYEMLNQEQAALRMEVSRPTLTRIYDEARQKVAKAFVEGRDLVFRGGVVAFAEDWYKCNQCKHNFPASGQENTLCPVCGSSEILSVNGMYSKESRPQ